jgi:hypothetical protein
MEDKFNFGKVLERIQTMKSELPTLLANQAQRFFVSSFESQGWTDSGLNNWKEVQRRIEGTPEWKYPKNKGLSRRTSPILIRTGTLRRAVSNSIRQVSFEKISLRIDSDSPNSSDETGKAIIPLNYAKYLNEGTDKIAKRKFFGDSQELRKNQKELIKSNLDKIWQG